MNYSIDIRLPAEFLVLADQYLLEWKNKLTAPSKPKLYCTLVSGKCASRDEELLRESIRAIHQPPFEVSLERCFRTQNRNSLVVLLQQQEKLLEFQSTIIKVIEGHQAIRIGPWYHPYILLGYYKKETFQPELAGPFGEYSWMVNEFLLLRNRLIKGLELVEQFPLIHPS